MAKVLHIEEVGKGLIVESGKLNASLGANLDFKNDKIDLKEKMVKSISLSGNVLTVTTTEGDETITLPKVEDVKLSGAELTAENKLKLTMSNGTTFEADLAKFIDAPKSAQEYWNEIKALPTFKADLLAVLKGEEMKNFNDELKGYLLTTA